MPFPTGGGGLLEGESLPEQGWGWGRPCGDQRACPAGARPSARGHCPGRKHLPEEAAAGHGGRAPERGRLSQRGAPGCGGATTWLGGWRCLWGGSSLWQGMVAPMGGVCEPLAEVDVAVWGTGSSCLRAAAACQGAGAVAAGEAAGVRGSTWLRGSGRPPVGSTRWGRGRRCTRPASPAGGGEG